MEVVKTKEQVPAVLILRELSRLAIGRDVVSQLSDGRTLSTHE